LLRRHFRPKRQHAASETISLIDEIDSLLALAPARRQAVAAIAKQACIDAASSMAAHLV
jgi:hypothetical protein